MIAVFLPLAIIVMPLVQPSEKAKQSCTWRICEVVDGLITKCDAEKSGTFQGVVQAIKVTEVGAVKWQCGPKVESKNEDDR